MPKNDTIRIGLNKHERWPDYCPIAFTDSPDCTVKVSLATLRASRDGRLVRGGRL